MSDEHGARRLHTLKLVGYAGGICELFDLTTGESFSSQFAVTDVKVLFEDGIYGSPRIALILDCPLAIEVNPVPCDIALPLATDCPPAPFRKGEDMPFGAGS